MKKMKQSVLNVLKNRQNPQSKHLRIFFVLMIFFHRLVMPFVICSSKYDICHLVEELPMLNLKQLITILTGN